MNIKKYIKCLIAFGLIFSVLLMFIFYFYLYPLKYKELIVKYANLNSVNSHLVASIICAESKFNKDAKSLKGAIGLMQLMPKTAEWICEKEGYIYSYDKLFVAEYNIKLGTSYLSYLISKFKNEDTAIVAYNAGEGVTKNWLQNNEYSKDGKTLNKIPYVETRTYLKKVKLNTKIYINRI